MILMIQVLLVIAQANPILKSINNLVGNLSANPNSAMTGVDFKISLSPSVHSLKASAEIHWNSPQKSFDFSLHRNLSIAPNEAYTIEQRRLQDILPDYVQSYRLTFRTPQMQAHLDYQGLINEPIVEGQSPGIITDQGVSLLSESFWHPLFDTEVPWRVEVQLPDSTWKVMIPGVRTQIDEYHVRFESYTPVRDLALVADRFQIFQTFSGSGKWIQVWLKNNEAALAQSYLNLVPNYIDDYSSRIGAFPFSGYTVVENSLETGYAFPGFTLLGPSVIRLPFLLRSSLPHEVLHSWWGNSVLVDYNRGNWCEGLTTYMADHFYAIKDGKGPEYRRSTLQNFQNFVSQDKDFPLREFVSRNDRGTQAVGYGKSMMLFQMLENYLGADKFYGALSQFFTNQVWKTVGFADLQKAFEKHVHQSLDAFFLPWLDQLGAPHLAIHDLKISNTDIELTLQQTRTSGAHPYVLPLKLRVLSEDGSLQDYKINLVEPEQKFHISAIAKPKKLWIDPEFEVFRTLYAEETPFAMSQILSENQELTISLPVFQREAYESWVDAFQGLYSKKIRVITDQEPMPTGGALWVIGYQNQHSQILKTALKVRQLDFTDRELKYNSKIWNLDRSSVFVGESLNKRPVVWVWADEKQPATVLVQKIKHYTTFSIVGFTDQKNDFKQTWPILSSPLIREF